MLLGIDLGTGSAKALLLDINGTVINEASSSYPVQAPHPGWAESNPIDWWLAVAVVVRKVVEKRGHQVRAIAGFLTATASEHLGLPVSLPVIAGAADTAAAALGNGLVEPGLVQLTIGTAAQIITIHSQPILDPQNCTHLYRAAAPNQWYSLAAMQNAGLALEWVRTILGLSWQQVYQDAFTVSPGCEGLTFLPYLTGERTPHLDPEARGAWVGLGLYHTRAHLMRAALEGVAFSLKQGLEALEATGVTVTELRLAGGGTLERDWQQLLADILRVPLYTTTVVAASARGAALLAGIGIGVYQDVQATLHLTPMPTLAATPNPDDSAFLEAWRRYQNLYPQLKKVESGTQEFQRTTNY